jgi:hypothetical protein
MDLIVVVWGQSRDLVPIFHAQHVPQFYTIENSDDLSNRRTSLVEWIL